MDIWETVQSAAVLGTERQPFTLPVAEGPLGTMLARIKADDPEHALLGALALVGLYRKIGRTPATDDGPLPMPFPTDDQPHLSSRAVQCLAQMFAGLNTEALPEFLELAAQAGQCVPPAYAMQLLEIGTNQTNLQEAITGVAGMRGRWLARQNEKWGYAIRIEQYDETLWHSGDHAVRLALLKYLRNTDHAQARTLLTACWKEEDPKQRLALLPCLAAGLSPDDEPFLETVLNNRRQEVRALAAELLARIPESNFSRRMIERVEPLLSYIPGTPAKLFPPKAATKAKLEITLPAPSIDKAMVRDGIEEKVPANRAKLGERGWRLLQMLMTIPPAHWSERWGIPPTVILDIVVETEWGEMLLEAWTCAAILHHDMTWAIALCPRVLRKIEIQQGKNHAISLLSLLPDVERESLVIDNIEILFETNRLNLIYALLTYGPRHWSQGLSSAISKSICSRLTAPVISLKSYWALESIIKPFALHAAPEELPKAISLISSAHANLSDEAQSTHWTNQLRKYVDLMRFRLEMLEAFACTTDKA